MQVNPGEPSSERTGKLRRILREAGQYALIILVTLAVAELALRYFNPRYLQNEVFAVLNNQYDPELGWSLIPNSPNHNSLGLRDIEFVPDKRPIILVLGDSMVWGLYLENGQRATDLLRKEMPGYTIVNAGVAGYGTDQEYLLLQRIWDKIKPAVVMVIYTKVNDRDDNTQNVRNFTYKPYFETMPDGQLQLRGQPTPVARRLHFRDNWLARNIMLARLAISIYVELRYRRIKVADPTENLYGAIRDFVEARGSRMLVGLQTDDPSLEAYLRNRNIPYTNFDGAEEDASRHWTPKGNVEVAKRLLKFFSEMGLPVAGPPGATAGSKP